MRPILFTGLLLLTIGRSSAQQTDKTQLLKEVYSIILPDTPYYACATVACGDQVQTIASGLTRVQDQKWPLAAIITSRLGKGKILVLGSDQYFRRPLLDDRNIRQLIRNSIAWAGNTKFDDPNTKAVQLWGNNPELNAFLHDQNVTNVITDSNIIHPATGVLLLARDVPDTVEQNNLEKFIRDGGTLIFGSPSAEKINKLFIKAGLYNVYLSFAPADNQDRLQIGAIPPYLQITTLLEAAGEPHFSPALNEMDAYTSTISNYLYHNDDTAATFRKIQKMFGPPAQGPVIPTPEHPLAKWNPKEFLTYSVQENLVSKQLISHPDPGYIHPASKTFPGAVDPAAKRLDERIVIPIQVGSQGLLEPGQVFYRWHSTGLYVPAGDKVKITINAGDLSQHLKAQIGVHDDELGHMDQFTRNENNLTRTFELSNLSTEIYSPFGGLLMINVPDTTSLKKINIRVSGAVRAPYFRLGVTSVKDWQVRIRDYPGPWAELASDKLILTVPAHRIRKLDDPEKLMRFWNEVMDADARLAAISTTRVHPERIIIDRQVAFGALFTTDRKIVAPDDENCALMLDEDLMRKKGSWGHFHELGHRHQFWGIDFNGLQEVTVNLYTMYIYDKVLHKGLYNHENIPSKEAVIGSIKKYMEDKPDFNKFCNEPFLALKMYIELIENFGWQPIEQVFRQYRMLPAAQYPVSEADKRDYWFTCICAATGRDLSAFFDKWQIPITEKARASVKAYPGWLPEELK